MQIGSFLYSTVLNCQFELYFVRFAACNTGISFLLHNIYSNFVALITILHKTGNKKKSTPTSGDHVSLIPLFLFAARGNVAQILMATEQSQNDDPGAPQSTEESQKKIDELLADPATRAALLQKLLSPPAPLQDPGTRDGAVPFPYSTLSGTSASSGWPVFPVPFPLTPAPGFPPFWSRHADATGGQSTPQRTNESNATVSDIAENGSSGLQSSVPPEEEDIIEPLGDAEALELVEFDPTVESECDWIPPQPILAFLEKHFTKAQLQGNLMTS